MNDHLNSLPNLLLDVTQYINFKTIELGRIEDVHKHSLLDKPGVLNRFFALFMLKIPLS